MRVRGWNVSVSSVFVGLVCAAAVACGVPGIAASPPPTIAVSGAVTKPAAWSVDDLRRTFAAQIQDIKYSLKGHDHTAKAIALYTLILQAEPRYNPHIKNHALQFVIEIQGHDGYTADFTLSELSPEIGGRHVWLALDEDGAPLADEAAPVEIVSPDDHKPARWVHGVAAITLVDMAAESAAGAAAPLDTAPPTKP
jgi:hypothetical protein